MNAARAPSIAAKADRDGSRDSRRASYDSRDPDVHSRGRSPDWTGRPRAWRLGGGARRVRAIACRAGVAGGARRPRARRLVARPRRRRLRRRASAPIACIVERDDRRGAARVAVWLAWDYWAFRGEHAVANGWLQRARRLLEGQPECAERAWLELREGSLALFEERRPRPRASPRRRRHPRRAGRRAASTSRCSAASVQGLALVASGAVAEGMRALDEVNAAVVAGELHDLVAIGLACCYMIAACERVRDYDRAVQWCTRLKAFCANWGLRPLFAVCRTQYASICMWRGTWIEAEQELTRGDRRARGLPSRDDRRRARAARRAAPAPGPPRRSRGAVRAGGAAQPGARSDARSLRSIATTRRRPPSSPRATCGACCRTTAPIAPPGSNCSCARCVAHGRHGRRADRAHRAHDIAALVETLPLEASASCAAGCVAAGAGRSERARSATSRTRSISSCRAARRSRSLARGSSWPARWPRGAAIDAAARRRGARWICSPS